MDRAFNPLQQPVPDATYPTPMRDKNFTKKLKNCQKMQKSIFRYNKPEKNSKNIFHEKLSGASDCITWRGHITIGNMAEEGRRRTTYPLRQPPQNGTHEVHQTT
jgi:hypothetical protein